MGVFLVFFFCLFGFCQGSHGIKFRFTASVIMARYIRLSYCSSECWEIHGLSSMYFLLILFVSTNRTGVCKNMVYSKIIPQYIFVSSPNRERKEPIKFHRAKG